LLGGRALLRVSPLRSRVDAKVEVVIAMSGDGQAI